LPSQELAELLTVRFNGCTETEHVTALSMHYACEGSNHHNLSTTYREVPTPYRRADEIRLGSTKFPRNQGIPRKLYATAEQLASRFSSISSKSTLRNVCLHEGIANPNQPLLAFNIDS
jgi:hypothetical protein